MNSKIKEALTPFTLNNCIFQCNEKAFEFMLDNNLLPRMIKCKKCDIYMTIQKRTRFINKRCYRCPKCDRITNINNGNKITAKYNIKFELFLRLISIWLFNLPNYAVSFFGEISEKTFIKFKESMIEIYDHPVQKIGGVNIRIQVDETAIYDGLIISNPSKEFDNKENVQWIIGGVEEENFSNFFLHLIPDRRSETILEIFKKYVNPGSIIVTDGYPSYPAAVRQFGSQHHSVGLVTNKIENLWSHLRQAYRKKHGVRQSRIHNFLKEFQWKKQLLLKYKEQESIINAFVTTIENLKKFCK